MTFEVRAEAPADARAIHAVHEACFPGPGEARLVAELRRRGELTVSVVAVADAAIVGHVAFSPLDVDGGIGLARVAVLETHRRHGVAAQLITAGLDRCRQLGFRFCVVLGEPAYYARFGFVAAPRHGLRDQYGGGDAFQVLALVPGGIPDGRGLVRYASAFESLG